MVENVPGTLYNTEILDKSHLTRNTEILGRSHLGQKVVCTLYQCTQFAISVTVRLLSDWNWHVLWGEGEEVTNVATSDKIVATKITLEKSFFINWWFATLSANLPKII